MQNSDKRKIKFKYRRIIIDKNVLPVHISFKPENIISVSVPREEDDKEQVIKLLGALSNWFEGIKYIEG